MVDGAKHNVVMQNVLFVPKLFCNLVSVSACRKKDLKMTFESPKDGRGLCIAEHRSTSHKVFTSIESKGNGLLEANFRSEGTIQERVLVTRNYSSDLWHLRLVHASFSTIQKTITLVQ